MLSINQTLNLKLSAMDSLSPKGCSSVSSSPYSSPNLTALLKIKIISWSQETGLHAAIQVQVADRIFSLHKLPLCSRSGYFKKLLSDNTTTKIALPSDFPGGSETFEMIGLFIYGSKTFIDPFNVASLRCAAEFLEMTSDFGYGNLCERTDLYLNQVVLQSWDDTLIVLQKLQSLLPYAEELLIDSRCIEALAFMACMEILDPEGRHDKSILSLEPLSSLHPWSSDKAKEIVCQDLWIKDLITLPFEFFKRVVCSLRRQGMKEKYVSPIVVFYANKWIISTKTRKFWECLCDENYGNVDTSDDNNVLEILCGVLDLLPKGQKGSKVIHVGFYFSLLSRSIELGLESKIRNMIIKQIVIMLPMARFEDFLIPKANGDEPVSSTTEFKLMINIFTSFVGLNPETDQSPPIRCSVVADLWDSYLCHIALNPTMEPNMFLNLIQVVPLSYRARHDYLYRAISTFLQEHPSIKQEERDTLCQHLNCQKLSQEVCIEAVQNELMPLRLIVQALLIQQMNTQQAFKDCSDSFRYTNSGDISGSSCLPKSLNLEQSPCMTNNNGGGPHSCELAKEYESTSFRIQSLEKELSSLKRSIDSERVKKGKTEDGCIGSVSFTSHRRYAGRIMRVFRGLILFGRVKPKRRTKSV
ncbi:hypothetical protein V2J09_020793 [Rumex salicifolius]